MLGINGGRIGTSNNPSPLAASGVWNYLEQVKAVRDNKWISNSLVIDGLVLYFDASNSISYPGSGTTWYDLSGNGNNATLYNGVGYSSSNGGSLVFDGINDYADFFAPNISSTVTIEMWCKLGSLADDQMMLSWKAYDVYFRSGMGYNTFQSDVYGIPNASPSFSNLLNNWVHYVYVMRSDVPYTNNKIYFNSVNQNLSQVLSYENGSNRNFNSGYGRISGTSNASGYYINMNCGYFRVYNRELTSSEVLQNFAVSKSRFGL